ncbi:hypothetical protein CDAR_60431 [Caerostris darwini]|uniref:Uncharacterized protein n=1 Tax=Caerostris darwini TaxID=1538125 RepID=A0AAV4QNN8_9ARAC|nr:hypothetical protein CDAR_60431 [Caerostris darwini]
MKSLLTGGKGGTDTESEGGALNESLIIPVLAKDTKIGIDSTDREISCFENGYLCGSQCELMRMLGKYGVTKWQINWEDAPNRIASAHRLSREEKLLQ